jgi:chaperonin GroEL (HSP60 family)
VKGLKEEGSKGIQGPAPYHDVRTKWILINNVASAITVAKLIETSLGPSGCLKVLSGMGSSGGERLVYTNDGAEILKVAYIESPVARVLKDMAEAVDESVGDGVKTAVVLAGSLLEEALNLLLKGVRPWMIIEGYNDSLDIAMRVMKELSRHDLTVDRLRMIALTAIRGKGINLWGHEERIADMVVEAVLNATEERGGAKRPRLENIGVEALDSGDLASSQLIRGVVTKPPYGQEKYNPIIPRRVEEAKVALLYTPLEVKKPRIGYRAVAAAPQDLTKLREDELMYLHETVDKFKALGVKAVLSGRRIDRVPHYLLGKEGIMAVRNIPTSDLKRIALATRGEVVYSLEDLRPEALGYSKLIEWRKLTIEGDWMLFVESKGETAVSTILLLGAGVTLKKAVEDAIRAVAAAVENGAYVGGGGAIELQVASRLRERSKHIGGVKSLIMEAFAKSLESIPRALAENARLKWVEVGPHLTAAHLRGSRSLGLDAVSRKVVDVLEAGIIEPLKVKGIALISAVETVLSILRVDEVLYGRGAAICPGRSCVNVESYASARQLSREAA